MKKCFSILLALALVLSLLGGCVTGVYAADNEPEVAEAGIVKESEETRVIPSAAYDTDPDELFAGYVDKEFMERSENNPGPMREPASSMLPAGSMELKIVNNLQPQMKQVADGQQALAAFFVDFDEAGIPWYYTAADLGVSSIVDSNNSLTQDAYDAFFDKAYPDTYLVMEALLYSLPYDVYWFDKTIGMAFDPGDIAYGTLNSTGEWVIFYKESLFFAFTVCTEFQDSSADYPDYTVKSSVGQSVQTSVNRAASIVSQNSGKPDYEKLLAYRDAICSLTEYNFPAVQYGYDYGNPWQLIWVFDGDASTKVVCEGYSKAFQYLCDMTNFRNKGISCRIVSGDMYANGSGGGHMWNVITMDDGVNYLVDVTNCDEGSYGSDDLFLDGVTGTLYGGYTALGYINYTYDDDMWDIYTDAKLALATTHYTPLTITAARLELKSKIGIRILFKVPEGARTAKFVFEANSYNEGKAITMTLDKNSRYYNASTGEFLFIFPEVTSKQMTDHVRFSVYGVNGNPLSIYYETENTWSENYFEYCVADWCNRIIRTQPSTAAVNMAKALLNYGGNAQKYLNNYKPESPTNPNNYFASENAAVQADANQNASIPAVAYDLGLRSDSPRLDLAADTSIRIYFTQPVSVTVDGNAVQVYNSGSTYLAIIEGITSRQLDHKYYIEVTSGNNMFGMSYSALSWSNKQIQNNNENSMPTARSLYLYNQAAKAYLGN